MMSVSINDVVTASVYSEKTGLKKFIVIIIIMNDRKKDLLVNDKRRCKDFFKKYGKKGKAFNYLQSERYVKMPACQRLMLHPYITTSEPSLIFYYRKLNSGVGH